MLCLWHRSSFSFQIAFNVYPQLLDRIFFESEFLAEVVHRGGVKGGLPPQGPQHPLVVPLDPVGLSDLHLRALHLVLKGHVLLVQKESKESVGTSLKEKMESFDLKS